MRTTPPFDPRVQPGGMYVGTHPQMYMQPMIHPGTQPAANFNTVSHPSAPYASPEYIMHGTQHQQHPQYNDKQIKMARP